MAYIGSPSECREKEGFSTNEHEEGKVDRNGRLIKELAPTLLSRQTRADTRLPGDICGRSSSLSLSLSLGGRYDAAFIYHDNDKRNDNSLLYVASAVVAATVITRDVVFMKRDKNSKRDPINPATRPRETRCRIHVSVATAYLMKMVKNKAKMTESHRIFYKGCACILTRGKICYFNALMLKYRCIYYENVFKKERIADFLSTPFSWTMNLRKDSSMNLK